MINKFFAKKYSFAIIVSTVGLLITSCSTNNNSVNVSNIKIEQKHLRFEKDLFESKDSITIEKVQQLRNTYGTFFNLFVSRIIHLPPANDSALAINLNSFCLVSKYLNVYVNEYATVVKKINGITHNGR